MRAGGRAHLVPRYRLLRIGYAVRRPLWSWYWLSSGYRMWRRDRFGRAAAAWRSLSISLPTAAWHACGCNTRIKGVRL